ncbi:hypothetical protein TI03_02010 [Achromatium sp. WMS1]|nr:hypothetical protein TI03_02010 [Achromatium sp. WMS1]
MSFLEITKPARKQHVDVIRGIRVKIYLLFILSSLLLSNLKFSYAIEATELSTLNNAELIDKATKLFEANEVLHKTYERAWQHDVLNLQIMAQQRAQTLTTASLPAIPTDPTLVELERQLAATKQQLVAVKRLPDLLQTERNMVNTQIERAEKAISILEGWISNITQIDTYGMEINLRIADRSMSKNSKPRFLTRQSFVMNRKRTYERYISTWQQRKESMREQLIALTTTAEQVKQTIINTELRVQNLSRLITKTQQIESFKEELAQKPEWQLLAMYQNIKSETEWSSGAFFFEFSQFEQLNTKITKLNATQTSTDPPTVEEIGQEAIVYNPEKATAYAEAIAKRIAYHTEEIKRIETLIELTETLAQKQTTFEVKGMALRKQLGKMQVLIAALKKRVAEQRLDASKLPRASESAALEQNIQNITKSVSKTLAIIAKAKESLPQLKEHLAKSRADLLSFQAKEATIQKALAHAQKREQQEVIFENLDAAALLDKMQASVQDLTRFKQQLPQMRQQADEMQTTVRNADFAWRSIKGPLFGIAEQEQSDTLYEIRTRFYSIAGITLPEQTQITDVTTQLTDPTLSLQKWVDNPQKPLGGLIEELQAYQRLLSSRIEFINENQQRKQALHAILTTERQHLAKMSEVLNETLTAARQTREGAIEIQKRLGRQNITPDQVPEDLEQWLSQNTLDTLQKELSTILQRKTWVEEQLTALNSEQFGKDTTTKQFNNLLGLVNSRLRILEDRSKLLNEYDSPFEKWSDTEKKNLTQSAIRRLEEGDGWSEFFLGFFASERGTDLTDIMRDYYAEVIKLESKLDNLNQQKKTIDRVLQLAENENTIVEDLLKAMQTWTSTLKAEKARQETRLRMQLLPEKAAEIQKHWEQETGKSIAIPVPFDTTKRQELLDIAINALFATEVELAAAQKWTTLFKARHSNFGIQSELAMYQGENGNITAQQKSVQRQLYGYLGFPAANIQQIQVVEGTLTPRETNRLQLGDVGVIRADRFKVQQNAAFWAIGKFIIILGIAVLLNQGIEHFVWRRMEKQAQRSIPHLVRGMVSFIIYTVALFMIVAFVFGQTLTGLLATSGVLAMVIGLAVQMNISNIFSGLAINLERPFQIGDTVKLNGIEGRIENISWRSTSIRSTMGNLVIIPNHTAAESITTNYIGTEATQGRVWGGFSVFLSGEEDPKEMETILKNAVSSNDTVTTDPWVMYVGFNEWAAEYWVYYSIPYAQRFVVLNDVQIKIHSELAKRNIKPQFKDVHNVID